MREEQLLQISQGLQASRQLAGEIIVVEMEELQPRKRGENIWQSSSDIVVRNDEGGEVTTIAQASRELAGERVAKKGHPDEPALR